MSYTIDKRDIVSFSKFNITVQRGPLCWITATRGVVLNNDIQL
jgi:hypothetical protein